MTTEDGHTEPEATCHWPLSTLVVWMGTQGNREGLALFALTGIELYQPVSMDEEEQGAAWGRLREVVCFFCFCVCVCRRERV